MSAFDTSCFRCGQQPNRSTNIARKLWRTTAGITWAYRCRCGANNHLASRPGWEAAAERALSKTP